MTRKTPAPETTTDAERAAEAARMLGKTKAASSAETWQEIADRLGYSCGPEACLAVHRVELAPFTPDMWAWMPDPWKWRAKQWNAELARAAKARRVITAKPSEPGYSRFAVDRVPDPPAAPTP
ncbi:MAG TPA: hypothetical protein VLW53_19640 [Candidatus Eisenbacteria bacterium]|nr:hypothetical protein [Candidatus Eisenbacteria bacterium]